MNVKVNQLARLSLMSLFVLLLAAGGCKKEDSPVQMPEDLVLTFPSNSAEDVSLTSGLGWEALALDGLVHYDVYVGVDEASMSLVSEGQLSTSYDLDLTSESDYYWKVVAKNDDGWELESPVWNFTTEMVHWEDGTSGYFIDPRDNHQYAVVKIGEQVWLAENLAYLPSVVDRQTRSVSTPYYYVYDYSGESVSGAMATSNYETYGVLYNVTAALTASPEGWHLPSDEEWTALNDYLEENGYGYWGSGDETAKSVADNSGWMVDNALATAGSDQATNNSTGFSLRPGGGLFWSGDFGQQGKTGYWWSSTPIEYSDSYYCRVLNYEYDKLDRQGFIEDAASSIRCLLD